MIYERTLGKINEEGITLEGGLPVAVEVTVSKRDESESPRLSVGQWYFPPALLYDSGPEVSAYYQQILFRLNRAVLGQGDNADPHMVQALSELDRCPQWLKEVNNDNR